MDLSVIKLVLENKKLSISPTSSDGEDEEGEEDEREIEEDERQGTNFEINSEQTNEILLPWKTEVITF